MGSSTLAKRLLVTFILLPVGLALAFWGGWAYIALIVFFLGLAAWEYVQLFRAGGFQPAGVFIVVSVLALILARGVESCGIVLPGLKLECAPSNGFESAPWLISLIVLVALTYHLIAYECGRDQAGSDFAITLAGIFYIGWIGAYLISLRFLPHGIWWLLLAMSPVWISDGGAYLVGSRFGRHKLSPRLSPKKTWEGYLGGILCGAPGTIGVAWLCTHVFQSGIQITSGQAALLGLILSILPTLGDLGESMIKRQVGFKDSGKLLPGHGGAFDRIDSWLWGAVIGYYVILWFFKP